MPDTPVINERVDEATTPPRHWKILTLFQPSCKQTHRTEFVDY